MIYRLLYSIFKRFPSIKQLFWKIWYTRLAQKFSSSKLKFMNYGYYSESMNISLKDEDELERYPIQLYHHVATKVALKGLKVLEVGSGRGGGSNYINEYLEPKEMIGLDLSSSAIDLCDTFYKSDRLSFLQGSSEDMPFGDNTFDVVINVESSHCYTSMDNFISEVSRVLKPNGHFLFCDLRRSNYVNEMLDQLNSHSLELLSYEDITSNVIRASDKMSVQRTDLINRLKAGKYVRNILKSFAGVKGGKVYDSFVNGYFKYISAVCINKE